MSLQIKEVVPYLRCKPAAAAIEFYKTVLGAEEIFRLDEKSTGRIGHAELKVGNTMLKLSDEYPEIGLLGPLSTGGSGTAIYLQVDDADALAARAVAAGATMLREPADQFYGQRSCKVRDPFATNGCSATRSNRSATPKCSAATTPCSNKAPPRVGVSSNPHLRRQEHEPYPARFRRCLPRPAQSHPGPARPREGARPGA